MLKCVCFLNVVLKENVNFNLFNVNAPFIFRGKVYNISENETTTKTYASNV